MGQIFERLSHDQDVRCVVFTGAGDKAFSSGLDVQAAAESGSLSGNDGLDPARVAQRIRHHIDEFQANISQIEKCEKRESILYCLERSNSILTVVDQP